MTYQIKRGLESQVRQQIMDALNDLQAQIDALIADLQSQIDDLDARVTALENP